MTTLTGQGTSQGTATGKCRLVEDHTAAFSEGDILVTRITNPGMVTLMGKAAAIVCDIGGLTSHPSIVSRELGIPCVVSAKDAAGKPATAVLKDGMRVKVDGEAGIVEVLDDA